MYGKTLIYLDGSKLAEDILPYAVEYCLGVHTEIILLQVITAHITIPAPESVHILTVGPNSKPTQMHTTDIGKTTMLEPKAGLQLREIEREQGEAEAYLNEIAKNLRSRSLKVRTLTLIGDVSETILRYAADTNVPLIALTTHGRGGLRRGTMGRVATDILKRAEMPVMLINPERKNQN